MLQKVSKSAEEMKIATNWWEDDSKMASFLSPTENASEHGDTFDNFVQSLSEMFGAIGCNFSFCTEYDQDVDDRIGDEIEVNTEHSELEDDITLDLNSSFVNTSTVSDGVSRIPGRRSIGGKR